MHVRAQPLVLGGWFIDEFFIRIMWRACRQRAGPCPLSFEIRRSGWHLKVWVGREEVILDLWDLQLPLGVILRLPFWGQAPDENCFEDAVYWEVSSTDLSRSSSPWTPSAGLGPGKPEAEGWGTELVSSAPLSRRLSPGGLKASFYSMCRMKHAQSCPTP